MAVAAAHVPHASTVALHPSDDLDDFRPRLRTASVSSVWVYATASHGCERVGGRRSRSWIGRSSSVCPDDAHTPAMRRVSERLPVLGWRAWSSSRASVSLALRWTPARTGKRQPAEWWRRTVRHRPPPGLSSVYLFSSGTSPTTACCCTTRPSWGSCWSPAPRVCPQAQLESSLWPRSSRPLCSSR